MRKWRFEGREEAKEIPDSSEPMRRCRKGRVGIPSRVNPASDSEESKRPEVGRWMGSGEWRPDERSPFEGAPKLGLLRAGEGSSWLGSGVGSSGLEYMGSGVESSERSWLRSGDDAPERGAGLESSDLFTGEPGSSIL